MEWQSWNLKQIKRIASLFMQHKSAKVAKINWLMILSFICRILKKIALYWKHKNRRKKKDTLLLT